MQTSRVVEADVAILGAGVAGCAAALALSRQGFRVALLERTVRCQQRFCGEFVSGEALPLLEGLGVGECVRGLGANPVRCLALHPARGRPFKLPLAAGGFGLSRRALDALLLERAVAQGATLFAGTQVTAISGTPGEGFLIQALAPQDRPCVLSARAVIGAHGKQSSVDRLLGRSYCKAKRGWIGVRQQFHAAPCPGAVALYLFPGGYCGAISTETGLTTLALLARERTLKACRGRPDRLLDRARLYNAALRERLESAAPVAESLMTISRISFAPKQPVLQGVFMIGDSALVTPPFLGIGIAGALGSALACAQAVGDCLSGPLGWEDARRRYERWWRGRDKVRKLARPASWLLCHPLAGDTAVRLLERVPMVANAIYQASRVTEPPDRPTPAAAGSALAKPIAPQASSQAAKL